MTSVPRSRTRTALFNAAFQYVAVLLSIVQGFVLVPLYLRSIPLVVYGAWLASGNVLAWIELVDPGVAAVLQQRVALAYGRRDNEALAATIGTGVALSLGISLLPLFAWPFAGAVVGLLGLSAADGELVAHAFKIGLAALSIAIASYGVTAVNLALQRSVSIGLVYTVSAIAGIVVTLGLLHAGVGIASIAWGSVARTALLFAGNALLLGHWLARARVRPSAVRRDELSALAGMSAYTFTSRLGSTLLSKMDVFLTASLLSPSVAAVLALTGKSFELVRLGTERLSVAAAPSLSHLAGEKGTGVTGDVVLRITGVVLILAIGGTSSAIALNEPFVRIWIGSDKFGGQMLTILLGAAAAMAILSATMQQILGALGGFKQSSVATLCESGIKVGALLLLLPTIGILAAPVAALIGSFSVQAWYLPRELSRITGDSRCRRAVPARLAQLAVAILVGAIAHALLPGTWVSSWGTLGLAAASVAVVVTAGAAFANRGLLRQTPIFRRVSVVGSVNGAE